MTQAAGPWWTAWTLDLPSLAMVAGLSAIYLRGAARRSAAKRRANAGADRSQRRRTTAFLAGAAVVALSEMSPVAAIGEQLLWVHMVQHLLIIVVAAPLLAAGAPVTTIRPALGPWPRHQLARLARTSRRWRRTSGAPPALVLATALHAAMVWAWHVPALYDAAVRSPALHLLEHAALLGSAVWFWSEIWATAHRRRRAQALATLCLGATIMQGGLLGALLVFAGRPLYAVYSGAMGFTALEDQQLAGGLMWVPPAFVYAPVAIRRFVGWMQASEQDLRRREAAHRTDTAARRVDTPAGGP